VEKRNSEQLKITRKRNMKMKLIEFTKKCNNETPFKVTFFSYFCGFISLLLFFLKLYFLIFPIILLGFFCHPYIYPFIKKQIETIKLLNSEETDFLRLE